MGPQDNIQVSHGTFMGHGWNPMDKCDIPQALLHNSRAPLCLKLLFIDERTNFLKAGRGKRWEKRCEVNCHCSKDKSSINTIYKSL